MTTTGIADFMVETGDSLYNGPIKQRSYMPAEMKTLVEGMIKIAKLLPKETAVDTLRGVFEQGIRDNSISAEDQNLLVDAINEISDAE